MSITQFTPFIPGDHALQQSDLPDKAMTLITLSAQLTGQLSPLTRVTLEQYMAVINSYYSNLIEGNATRPYEVRAAQRGEYHGDPAKRDLQQESLAHIQVQQWLQQLWSQQQLDLDRLFSPQFIGQMHQAFYAKVPESLWAIKNQQDQIVAKMQPGQWRDRQVIVGRHVPPEPEELADLMTGFCEVYHPKRFYGDRKLIAVLAAHHRLAWIHPFFDGNGRIGRLMTDAALKAIGLESTGVWCLSRGLARTAAQYKSALSVADFPRQGDYDGRGALSEKGLLAFCDYLLDTAIDQVRYISGLLDLKDFRQRIEHYVQARQDRRVAGVAETLPPIASQLLWLAFIQGELDRGQALRLCAMPERSARRLLSQLKNEGLLSETSNKSTLRWEIPDHTEAWYFPGLVPLA